MEEKAPIDLKSLQEKFPDAPDEMLQNYVDKKMTLQDVTDDLSRLKEKGRKEREVIPKISERSLNIYRSQTVNDMAFSRKYPGRQKTPLELDAEGVTLPPGRNIDPVRFAHSARRHLLKYKYRKQPGSEGCPITSKEKILAEINAITNWLNGKSKHPSIWDGEILEEFPSRHLDDLWKILEPQSISHGQPARVAALPEEEFLSQKKLEAFFEYPAWNTIKDWAQKFGIKKPDVGDPWPITQKDAIDMKAMHDKYYKKKKRSRKQK